MFEVLFFWDPLSGEVVSGKRERVCMRGEPEWGILGRLPKTITRLRYIEKFIIIT